MLCSAVPHPHPDQPIYYVLLCTRDHIQKALQSNSALVHMAPLWVHQPGQPWLLWPCHHDKMLLSWAPTFPGTAVLQWLAGRSSLIEEAAVAHSWQDN